MKHWQPTPFIWLCLFLHALALPILWLTLLGWRWVLAALVLLHGVIAIVGLLPRSTWLGQNVRRLPEAAVRARQVAITIDDGPDPDVTPAVLAILRQHGARASFFCIGERAARYPALCRQIVAEGHRIENHGQRHRPGLSLCGPDGWRREILPAQRTLQALCGQTPRFFRPIAGLRNPFLAPVLQQSGLLLASWTRRGYDTRQHNPDVVLARLCRRLAAGDVLLLHDGHAARTTEGQAVILAVLPRLLAVLAAHRLTPVTLCQASAEEDAQTDRLFSNSR